jgi:hypothetical protein
MQAKQVSSNLNNEAVVAAAAGDNEIIPVTGKYRILKILVCKKICLK